MRNQRGTTKLGNGRWRERERKNCNLALHHRRSSMSVRISPPLATQTATVSQSSQTPLWVWKCSSLPLGAVPLCGFGSGKRNLFLLLFLTVFSLFVTLCLISCCVLMFYHFLQKRHDTSQFLSPQLYILCSVVFACFLLQLVIVTNN